MSATHLTGNFMSTKYLTRTHTTEMKKPGELEKSKIKNFLGKNDPMKVLFSTNATVIGRK